MSNDPDRIQQTVERMSKRVDPEAIARSQPAGPEFGADKAAMLAALETFDPKGQER
ncbi:hypothetical protein AB0M22_09275 [Nocardia sp. NPDC051756]|uniref:hypothetical protein n=1 Tax=Nocardia sp. NPDC051756 TaxID=3154751 RepID=UPI00343B054C